MSNNALVTATAKDAARTDLNSYAELAYGHLTRDWSEHSAARVHAVNFTDSAGDLVAPLSLRLGLTLGSVDYVVACPLINTGITISEGAVPVITVQPSSQSAQVGTTAVFSVVAVAATAIAYQWYKNGALMVGQTGSQLVLLSVSSSDQAVYYVTLTNAFGSLTSASATLSVVQTVTTPDSSGPGPDVEVP